jgi:hypothetical protein
VTNLTDPAAVSAAVAGFDSVLAAPVMQSFLTLAPLLSISGTPLPAATVARSATCGAVASDGLAAAPAFVSGSIPDSVLRHVFVYDSATARYRLTADTSGPSAGVRFLLYRVYLGQVLSPLTAIGHYDLDTAALLHAIVSDSAGSAAAYSIAPIGIPSADSAVLAGTIVNGGHAASFRDSISVVGSQTTVRATLSDSGAGVHVTLAAVRTVADKFDRYYTLTLAFRHGQQSVGAAGTINVYCNVRTTNLSLSVNDIAFATVTNDVHGLIYTRADSQPVTTQQMQAINDLLASQDAWFQALATLFVPPRQVLP